MIEQIEFKKERISSFCKVSKEFISELNISAGTDYEDMIYDTLTVKLDAFIYSALQEERVLTYYCPRPTFLDWLLRRKRKVEWTLKVKDLMLNPPKNKNSTMRIYLTDLK